MTQTDTPEPHTSMAPRPLGRGGPLVAPFALGTMTFGAEADEATSQDRKSVV